MFLHFNALEKTDEQTDEGQSLFENLIWALSCVEVNIKH